jgi:hypothetical protein
MIKDMFIYVFKIIFKKELKKSKLRTRLDSCMKVKANQE